MSVTRALNPEDDISWNESFLGRRLWRAGQGSARKTHGKRAWGERGRSGAHEGHQTGTFDDLLEGGTQQLMAPENRQARHWKGTGNLGRQGQCRRWTRGFQTAFPRARGRGREGATGKGRGD